MAGRGPAPKDPDRRARTNSDPVPAKVLEFKVARQPPLPKIDGVEWHSQTRAWWRMWKRSPQAGGFTETDWSFLLDTALMHHAMWSRGQWTLAAEVRLRVAKFGATPEDRARLRWHFADTSPVVVEADESPRGLVPAVGGGLPSRYSGLRAVD